MRKQTYTLDPFISCHILLKPVDFSHNKSDHLRIAHKLFAVVRSYPLLLGPSLKLREIRNDKSRNKLTLIPYHRHLIDIFILRQTAFHHLRSHILSIRSLEQILHTLCEHKLTRRGEISGVACAEIAILGESLLIGFGILIISRSHCRALHKNLIILRIYLHIQSRKRHSYRAYFIIILREESHGGGGFAQSITDDDIYAYGSEKLAYTVGKRRTGRREEIRIGNADCMFQTREYPSIPELVFLLKKPRHIAGSAHIGEVSFLSHGDGAFHHHLLHLPHSGYLLLHPGIHLFPETGNSTHKIRMNVMDILLNHAGIIIYSDCHSFCEAIEAPGLLQDMAHRKEGHGEIRTLHFMQKFEMLRYAGIIVSMSDHHPLGFTRGAGGIDQSSHIVGERALLASLHLSRSSLRSRHAETHEIIPINTYRIIRLKLQAIILENNNLAYFAGIIFPEVVSQGVLMTVADEKHRRFAIIHNKIKLRLRTARIYGNCRDTVFKCSELSDENLRSVGRADRNAVFLQKPHLGEGLRGHFHLKGKFTPGGGEPFPILAPAEPISLPVAEAFCVLRNDFNQFICHDNLKFMQI